MAGNGCRRGVWQRVLETLTFPVSIGLGMLCRHGTSSKELVSYVLEVGRCRELVEIGVGGAYGLECW